MVRHIVAWNFRPELSEQEKMEGATAIQKALEGLDGRIDGLLSIRVITDPKTTCDRAIVLHTDFESEDALKGYQVHPEHVAASSMVKTLTCDRICLDFDIEA